MGCLWLCLYLYFRERYLTLRVFWLQLRSRVWGVVGCRLVAGFGDGGLLLACIVDCLIALVW